MLCYAKLMLYFLHGLIDSMYLQMIWCVFVVWDNVVMCFVATGGEFGRVWREMGTESW